MATAETNYACARICKPYWHGIFQESSKLNKTRANFSHLPLKIRIPGLRRVFRVFCARATPLRLDNQQTSSHQSKSAHIINKNFTSLEFQN